MSEQEAGEEGVGSEVELRPPDPDLVEGVLPTASPEDVHLTEREIQAVELRKAGYTYQEVADALGWEHKSSAMRAVRRALARWGTESVHELRILELSRLDTITKKLWPRIVGRPPRGDDPGQPPDVDAMMAYLKVSARRARLVGLDASDEIDLFIHTDGDQQLTAASERVVHDIERFSAIVESIARESEQEAVGEDDSDGEEEGGG